MVLILWSESDCQVEKPRLAYYKKAPSCKIVNYENGDEVSYVSTVYIPDHLENMVYEILKNAFR